MAFFESGPLTGRADLFDKLKTFAEANGWTVDLFVANDRMHLHKGGYHFELTDYGQELHWVGCTGYDAGAGAFSQPGTSQSIRIAYSEGQKYYWFVSTEHALYVMQVTDQNLCWLSGIGWLVDKCGVWNDGQFVAAGTGATFFRASSYQNNTMLINGAWSGLTLAGNGIVGTNGSVLGEKQPILFNAGILPVPIMIYQAQSTNYRAPIGLVPDVLEMRGGDIYRTGDVIEIGGSNHVLLPADNAAYASARYASLAFKMGA